MTREIKFRAWTGLEMEYNVVAGKFGSFYVNPGAKGDGLDEKDSASLTSFNTRYSEQVPVMQFTGLLDKNGKEIYEGDVLNSLYSFEGCKGVYEVVWNEGAFRPKRHGIHQQMGVTISMHDLTRCEVIGNIYENPELIKKP